MKAVTAKGRDFATDPQKNTLGMRCQAGGRASGRALCFALKTDKRNNGSEEQTVCSKCLVSACKLVNLREYRPQTRTGKSKLPGFCGGELISPSMTPDRKGLLLLL